MSQQNQPPEHITEDDFSHIHTAGCMQWIFLKDGRSWPITKVYYPKWPIADTDTTATFMMEIDISQR